jgi:catechol 2,3-dioxygenase-like lactoylglutathione lyase family enzyme
MKQFKTFTSFSVDNIETAEKFYTTTLGVDSISRSHGGMRLFDTAGDTQFMIYEKEDHRPAAYTVLNFKVDDLENIIRDLKSKGAVFESIEGANDDGIAEMDTVKAAWTRDPAGNWLAFFQGM